jgi:ribonucleotide monophosphatase NagD (HAD superfamily)
MRKVPGIISDIDGVLIRGSNAIKRSRENVMMLKKPLNQLFKNNKEFSNHSNRIPFVCLTNGGGMLEGEKANQLNKYLDL